jgi:fatty acid amide hydrolase
VTDLNSLSALEMARCVAAGEVSAVELVDRHIRRIEVTHATINAVVWPRFEAARAEAAAADAARVRGDALGPLHGVPITIKDQFAVAGLPNTGGVARLRTNVSAADGPLVAALRRAGAIVLGKTNVPQTMGVIETDNAMFGRTCNPWDPTRTSGGSSGGEAAAIAAGGSALGLGSDFGGSVRVPAAWCGLYGLKPTARRLPLEPLPVSTASGQEGIVAQPGVIARHAADVACGLRILIEATEAGMPFTLVPPVPWREPPPVAGLRVALLPAIGGWTPAPAVRRALREAADALRGEGVVVEDWSNAPDTQAIVDLFFALVGADGFGFVRDMLGGEPPVPLMKPNQQLTSMPALAVPVVAQLLKLGGQDRMRNMLAHAAPMKSADGLMRLLYRRIEAELGCQAALEAGRFDAILCPALPIAAPPHGTVNDMGDFWGSALMFNVLGWPAGVAPITRVRPGEESDRPASRDKAVQAVRAAEQGSAGLPVAVQLAAPPWREDRVLALMGALERACATRPDFPRTPPG